MGQTTALFDRPSVLLGFYAVLIAVSLASYRMVERPSQAWIRRCLPRREPVPVGGLPAGGGNAP